MKKIAILMTLVLSFNVFSADEGGSGGTPSGGEEGTGNKLLKPQKPQPVLVCKQVKIDGDGSGVKSVCFVVKGDGEGTGGKQ